jgi:predicted lipoprotein with Yx(FWY)xxD motif
MEHVSGFRWSILALFAIVSLGGCGSDDGDEQRPSGGAAPVATETAEAPDASMEEPKSEASGADAAAQARRPAGEDGLRVPAERARIVLDKSPFGRVLFDSNGQVIYAFENDGRNRSRCTSEDCVKAWPPVLTREPPTAGAGIDAALLGTIRRGDGMLQVTFNGRPLYFYEHEGPGEVRCHNVDLHGGLWWVLTPRGEPAD